MYKYRVLFVLAAGAGLIGGVLRALELYYDFERDTGLLSYTPAYTYSLMILSAVVMICSLLIVLFTKKSDDEYTMETVHRPGTGSNILFVCTVTLHIITSAVMILTSLAYPMVPISDFFGGCLLLLSGFAIVVTVVSLNRQKITSSNSLFLLIPVFWSCFYLILLFKDVVANANLESYIYLLLSVIFGILTYFCFASYLVSRGSLKKLAFVIACSIYFNALCFIGVFAEQTLLYNERSISIFRLFVKDIAYLHSYGAELLIYLCMLSFSVSAAVYFSRNERKFIKKLSID